MTLLQRSIFEWIVQFCTFFKRWKCLIQTKKLPAIWEWQCQEQPKTFTPFNLTQRSKKTKTASAFNKVMHHTSPLDKMPCFLCWHNSWWLSILLFHFLPSFATSDDDDASCSLVVLSCKGIPTALLQMTHIHAWCPSTRNHSEQLVFLWVCNPIRTSGRDTDKCVMWH